MEPPSWLEVTYWRNSPFLLVNSCSLSSLSSNAYLGGYYEVIYLNIDKIDPNMVLKDKSLAEVDAIFGRMCFCTKESTGYFPIRKGVLKSKKNRVEIQK